MQLLFVRYFKKQKLRKKFNSTYTFQCCNSIDFNGTVLSISDAANAPTNLSDPRVQEVAIRDDHFVSETRRLQVEVASCYDDVARLAGMLHELAEFEGLHEAVREVFVALLIVFRNQLRRRETKIYTTHIPSLIGHQEFS